MLEDRKTGVYWIEGVHPNGKLGITARPRGGDWLVDDVRIWKECGVNLVVSLLTDDEVMTYLLASEAAECAAVGIDLIRFPIEDMSVPQEMTSADDLIRQILSRLDQGERIVIHCRIGIGRSSTFAAAVMTHLGEMPPKSFQTISKFRGHDVPDTDSQIAWVAEYTSSPETLIKRVRDRRR